MSFLTAWSNPTRSAVKLPVHFPWFGHHFCFGKDNQILLGSNKDTWMKIWIEFPIILSNSVYPSKNLNTSLNEIMPSTHLLPASTTITLRTPEFFYVMRSLIKWNEIRITIVLYAIYQGWTVVPLLSSNYHYWDTFDIFAHWKNQMKNSHHAHVAVPEMNSRKFTLNYQQYRRNKSVEYLLNAHLIKVNSSISPVFRQSSNITAMFKMIAYKIQDNSYENKP